MTTRIFVDVTRTACAPFVSGIQRVVRQLVAALADEAEKGGIEVVPVIVSEHGATALASFIEQARAPWAAQGQLAGARGFSARARATLGRSIAFLVERRNDPGYRLAFGPARALWRSILSVQRGASVKPPRPDVVFRSGDILLMPDSAWSNSPWHTIEDIKSKGGQVFVVWYDMIPVLHPEFFDADLADNFRRYLDAMLHKADGLIAISGTVHQELRLYGARRPVGRANVHQALPAVHISTVPRPRDEAFQALFQTPTLFLLSTLEPRKGHALLLDAAEQLWSQGYRFNVLFAGRIGWKVQALVQRLAAHPQRGQQLFVYHDLSDAEVAYALSHARSLLLPSQAEGLGLPILEAEHFGCPVICTDLPVFREVAGPDTQFFWPYTAEALARLLLPVVQSQRLTAPPQRPGPASARTPADYARDILDIMLSHAVADTEPMALPEGTKVAE